jgi:hypothetical protein
MASVVSTWMGARYSLVGSTLWVKSCEFRGLSVHVQTWFSPGTTVNVVRKEERLVFERGCVEE